MIRFDCDYLEGAHPAILQKLLDTNMDQTIGYGEDPYCAAAAEKILAEKGYLIKLTDVVGVKIGDAPGKLSGALKVLGESRINVEYLYAFLARTEKHAYVVLRVEDTEAAENILTNAGYHLITRADVEKL